MNTDDIPVGHLVEFYLENDLPHNNLLTYFAVKTGKQTYNLVEHNSMGYWNTDVDPRSYQNGDFYSHNWRAVDHGKYNG